MAAGLVLLMVFIAIRTVREGAHPSDDRGAHWEGPSPYPTEAIETWLSVMAAECLVICMILRGRGPEAVGARALVLGFVMFFARIGFSPLGRHAGTPIPEHFTWMGLASIWLVACAIVAGLARRRRSHDDASWRAAPGGTRGRARSRVPVRRAVRDRTRAVLEATELGLL